MNIAMTKAKRLIGWRKNTSNKVKEPGRDPRAEMCVEIQSSDNNIIMVRGFFFLPALIIVVIIII